MRYHRLPTAEKLGDYTSSLTSTIATTTSAFHHRHHLHFGCPNFLGCLPMKTLLMQAAMDGNIAYVQKLPQSGTNLSKGHTSPFGNSWGMSGLFRELLAKGADQLQKDLSGH